MKTRKIIIHVHKQRAKSGGPPWTLHYLSKCIPAESFLVDQGVEVRSEERPHLDSNPKFFLTARVAKPVHTGGNRYLLTNKAKARPNARTRARRQHR